MGEISEYYRTHEFEEFSPPSIMEQDIIHAATEMERRYSLGVLKWTDKTGQKTLIKNMGTDYIKNCIAFLKKKQETEVIKKWIELFGFEIIKRNG